ncbi:sulfur oxidation c-type cytochrome SoxA [Prosthecomicrobium sp. N25]|uniref:sulfur oxidation c-type cytochrome SoxA n=1 Tax=Prosthecomicrobium sp. N25 TaxID=3129254 RepID=UPI00307735D2
MKAVAAVLVLGLAASGPVLADGIAPGERRSGAAFMSEETRAMEADDSLNPGMLWVEEGEALWRTPAGASGRSCADCHGDAARSMAGVAARHPVYDAATGAPRTLAGSIAQCRSDRQGAPRPAPESPEMLALSAYVARQSRGMSITAGEDPRLAPSVEAGRRLFTTRMGQLALSCADCHDDNWGRRLGGAPIPQAHPTAYPLYRLEWQSLGSLQRRLRNCLAGMRAEPWPEGSDEAAALELFLMARARGMPLEAPGVRP